MTTFDCQADSVSNGIKILRTEAIMTSDKDWTNNIKNFLNKKLQENNLSINKLAKLTDIPSTTMREMMNNRRPEIKNIVKLADYFHCSIDEILFKNDPKISRR